MDRWEFVEGPDGRFMWRRLSYEGRVLAESAASYAFLSLCLDDARTNGYPRDGAGPHSHEIKRVRFDGDGG